MPFAQGETYQTRLTSDPILIAALAMSGFSLLVWCLVWMLGLHVRPEQLDAAVSYTTYFEAVNWWPFPAFFLAITPIIYLSSGSFLKAWQDLGRTGVLRHLDKSAPDEATLSDVIASVRSRRRWAVMAAMLAALIINVLDFREKGDVLFGDADLRQQTEYVCVEFHSWNRWFVEARELYEATSCTSTSVPAGASRIDPPLGDTIFILATWAQQTGIVFLVSLAVGQMLLHGILFWGFERLVPAAREHGLVLRLNAASEVGEFGLERWNYALNSLYWAISPAMLGVFLSRAATPAEQHDPGQQLMGILVPACLLAPMIISILSRQSRLPYVWPEVGAENGYPRELYAGQLLWPLDRNWSAKLGIILAFSLAALSLGYELSTLMPLT